MYTESGVNISTENLMRHCLKLVTHHGKIKVTMDMNDINRLKSRYATAFGYYVEKLYCQYLFRNGIKFMSRALSSVRNTDIRLVRNFCTKYLEALSTNDDLRNLFAFWFSSWFDYSSETEIVRKITDFNLRDIDPEEFVGKLIATNFVELIRWENGNPVITEIKSSYGPDFPYQRRVTISLSEILKLSALRSVGVETSLVYQIALNRPRFIEIPIDRLPLPSPKDNYLNMLRETVPLVHPGGKVEIFTRYHYKANIAIPPEFDTAFQELTPEGRSFANLSELIVEIEGSVPTYLLPGQNNIRIEPRRRWAH